MRIIRLVILLPLILIGYVPDDCRDIVTIGKLEGPDDSKGFDNANQ